MGRKLGNIKENERLFNKTAESLPASTSERVPKKVRYNTCCEGGCATCCRPQTLGLREGLLETFKQLAMTAPNGKAINVPVANIFIAAEVESDGTPGAAHVYWLKLAEAVGASGRLPPEQMFLQYRHVETEVGDVAKRFAGFVIEPRLEHPVVPYKVGGHPFNSSKGPVTALHGSELASVLTKKVMPVLVHVLETKLHPYNRHGTLLGQRLVEGISATHRVVPVVPVPRAVPREDPSDEVGEEETMSSLERLMVESGYMEEMQGQSTELLQPLFEESRRQEGFRHVLSCVPKCVRRDFLFLCCVCL